MTVNTLTYSNEKMTTSQLMQSSFETGALIVNFSQNQVTLNNDDLVLQPKVLELLVILCAANGNTVSKESLIDALWPDTVVGPDSLANTMARLRKVLNDDAKSPTYIKTVQRKGYVWLPSVSLLKKDIKHKTLNPKAAIIAATFIAVSVSLFYVLQPQPKKFPFDDFAIKKLNDGGYEVQVGIDGELTKEKEQAMLEEIKRITGEENSGMTFSVDEPTPDCADNSKENLTNENSEKGTSNDKGNNKAHKSSCKKELNL